MSKNYGSSSAQDEKEKIIEQTKTTAGINILFNQIQTNLSERTNVFQKKYDNAKIMENFGEKEIPKISVLHQKAKKSETPSTSQMSKTNKEIKPLTAKIQEQPSTLLEKPQSARKTTAIYPYIQDASTIKSHSIENKYSIPKSDFGKATTGRLNSKTSLQIITKKKEDLDVLLFGKKCDSEKTLDEKTLEKKNEKSLKREKLIAAENLKKEKKKISTMKKVIEESIDEVNERESAMSVEVIDDNKPPPRDNLQHLTNLKPILVDSNVECETDAAFHSIEEIEDVTYKYNELLKARAKKLRGEILCMDRTQEIEEEERKLEEEKRLLEEAEEIAEYEQQEKEFLAELNKSEENLGSNIKFGNNCETPNPVSRVNVIQFQEDPDIQEVVDNNSEPEIELNTKTGTLKFLYKETNDFDSMENQQKRSNFYTNYNMQSNIQKKTVTGSSNLDYIFDKLDFSKKKKLKQFYTSESMEDAYVKHHQNFENIHQEKCGSHQIPCEVLDAEKKSMEPDVVDSDFATMQISGLKINIEELPLASGSASLGIEWLPAPARFSFPLQFYNHECSIPASPFLHQPRYDESSIENIKEEKEGLLLSNENEEDQNDDQNEITYSEMVALTKRSTTPISRAFTPNNVGRFSTSQNWVDSNSLQHFPNYQVESGEPLRLDSAGKLVTPVSTLPEENVSHGPNIHAARNKRLSVQVEPIEEIMLSKLQPRKSEKLMAPPTSILQNRGGSSRVGTPNKVSFSVLEKGDKEVDEFPLPQDDNEDSKKINSDSVKQEEAQTESGLIAKGLTNPESTMEIRDTIVVEEVRISEPTVTKDIEKAVDELSIMEGGSLISGTTDNVEYNIEKVEKIDAFQNEVSTEKIGTSETDLSEANKSSKENDKILNNSNFGGEITNSQTAKTSHPGTSTKTQDHKALRQVVEENKKELTYIEKLHLALEPIHLSTAEQLMDEKKKGIENSKVEQKVLFKGGQQAKYSVVDGIKFFELVHDLEQRKKMTKVELLRYPTFNDPTAMALAMVGTEAEEDLETEIKKMTSLIDASSLPIPSHLRRRGTLYGRIGDFDSALNDFDRAIKFDPFNTEVYWFRHQLLLRNKMAEEALKDLDTVTDSNRLHLGAFQAKAKIYQLLGLPKLAIVCYSQVIKLNPDDADPYLQRACQFEIENEMVYANEDYKMVRTLDPTNIRAITNLAIYSFERQLWDDAIQAFSKLINLHPNHATAFMFKGRACAFLARWDEALLDLTTAIQISPNRADFFVYRGCLLKERNIQKAIEDFSVSILIDDSNDNHNAYYQRALLYYKLEKYDFAVIDFKAAIEMNPKQSIGYLNLGLIYMQYLQDYKNAHDCFSKSILHDAIQLRAYLCRGALYQKMFKENIPYHKLEVKDDAPVETDKPFNEIILNKNYKSNILIEKAVRDYSKCIHMSPGNYLVYLYRGKLLLKLHMMRESTYDFHAAFELNSGIAQTFVQRVLVLSFRKQFKQIIEEFNKLSAAEKNENPGLFLLVAKAKLKCSDYLGALSDLDSALELDPTDSQIYLQKGICYEQLKRFNDAVAAFSKSIQINAEFAKAYFHRGNCKLNDGNSSGVKDLDKALLLDPKFFEAHLSRAAYFHSRGKYVEGIEDCNKALKMEPSSIRAHLLRGSCKCKLNQFQLAISDFTKACNLDKNCYFAYYNRAVTYQLINDNLNAIKDYSIVLLLSEDSNTYRNRGLIYWKTGDTDNALLDLHSARDNFPEDANLHSLLALCLQKVGRMEEALESFTKAIQAMPLAIDAYLGRGNVYATMEKKDLAKRDYAKVLHMYPKCAEAYINIAYIFQSEEKFKKAWETFTAIITINPKCTAAYDGRAIVYYNSKNYFGALLDITKAIGTDPTNAELYTNKGVIFQALNDVSSALKCYKKAISLNKNYFLASFNAANSYFQYQRWDTALEFYNKTLQLSPCDVAALLNRAITKVMLKKDAEAMEDFNRAVELEPNSPQIYFNRAKLYFSLGRLQEAEADYSKVIKLSPSDAMAYLKRGETQKCQVKPLEAMKDFASWIATQDINNKALNEINI